MLTDPDLIFELSETEVNMLAQIETQIDVAIREQFHNGGRKQTTAQIPIKRIMEILDLSYIPRIIIDTLIDQNTKWRPELKQEEEGEILIFYKPQLEPQNQYDR